MPPPRTPFPPAPLPLPSRAPLPRPAILDVLEDALALAHSLLKALQDEAEALNVMKLEAPVALMETKNRLIAAYAVRLEEIQETPKPLPPEALPLVETLKEVNTRVLRAAEANGVALEAAMEANRRVVDIVLRAAGEQQRRGSGVGYGRVGMRPTVKAAMPGPGALVATRL